MIATATGSERPRLPDVEQAFALVVSLYSAHDGDLDPIAVMRKMVRDFWRSAAIAPAAGVSV